jgi:hypothetical protein
MVNTWNTLQRIDKHYGEWLHIWAELTVSPGHIGGFLQMIGDTETLTAANDDDKPAEVLYIPLQFFMCRNPGLALPLIALQYHEVRVTFEFNEMSKLYKYGVYNAGTWTLETYSPSIALKNTSLFVDYIYLDTDERRRFAQVSHEMLIDQLQFTGDESVASKNVKIKTNFNHPVKELIWVVQPATNADKRDWFDFTLAGANPVVDAQIQLNGHDRFSKREGKYFNLVQPFQHHDNVPRTGINVYSFALRPAEHQPSGSCNMSRIDNCSLNLTLATENQAANIKIFAVNYNVLRIMSGMGGLNIFYKLARKAAGRRDSESSLWTSPLRIRRRRAPTRIGDRRRCQLLVVVLECKQTAATRPNCGKPLRALWYQVLLERGGWQAGDAWYGHKPEGLGNPQRSSACRGRQENAQRLDGCGLLAKSNLRDSPLAPETAPGVFRMRDSTVASAKLSFGKFPK